MNPLVQRIAKESLRLARDKLTRYISAELVGTASAIAAGAYAANHSGNNALAIGYASTLGETLGFYGTMLVRQVTIDRVPQQSYGVKELYNTTKNLAMEFGLAEIIDTPFIRPGAKAVSTHFLGPEAGIPLGKFIGDIAFFLISGTCHELRKRKEKSQ